MRGLRREARGARRVAGREAGVHLPRREIETVLTRHPEVERAVVDLRAGRLTAWVVPAAGCRPEGGALAGLVARSLPEFMVPADVILLPELPLTPAGKVDRRALPDPEPAGGAGPRSGAARSEVPSGPLEETLAAVFREVLGREEIGVHDRFFELGGDSILAIRAVSRAARAGIRLEPRDLFENPTVAALAVVAAGRLAPRPAGEVIAGEVPLGPAQRWLLDLGAGVAGGERMLAHWNMALLLDVERRLPSGALGRAATALIAQHDMLRARFRRRDGAWVQVVEPPGGDAGTTAAATTIDLAALPIGRRRGESARVAARLQESLDLARGPLLRLAAIEPGEGETGRLALVVHHLVADAVSLRVLLDDLGAVVTAGGASETGEPTRIGDLSPRSDSFRARVAALTYWARSPAGHAEAAFWAGMLAAPPAELPADRPAGPSPSDREGSTARVAAVLSAEETEALLAEDSRGLRARPDEIALAGLVVALARRGGGRRMRLEIEGHGRAAHPSAPDLDLSRTVGWLTAFYPLAIELSGDDGASAPATPQAWLRAVKEAVRAVPAGGVGYGALRWSGEAPTRAALDPAAEGAPPAAIGFNFLGAIDEAFAGAADSSPQALAVTRAEDDPGPTRHPGLPRPLAIEVAAYLAGGRLHLDLSFSRARHRQETVATLAEETLAAVRELVAGAQGAESEALAATDFPHAGLERDQLARLLAKVGAGSGG